MEKNKFQWNILKWGFFLPIKDFSGHKYFQTSNRGSPWSGVRKELMMIWGEGRHLTDQVYMMFLLDLSHSHWDILQIVRRPVTLLSPGRHYTNIRHQYNLHLDNIFSSPPVELHEVDFLNCCHVWQREKLWQRQGTFRQKQWLEEDVNIVLYFWGWQRVVFLHKIGSSCHNPIYSPPQTGHWDGPVNQQT